VSHAVAVLQTSVPAGQAAVQQLPVPAMSQTPLEHSSSDVQPSPAGSLRVHVPEEQKSFADAQSASVAHDVLHAVALAHFRP
jgi:hypothetical protein